MIRAIPMKCATCSTLNCNEVNMCYYRPHLLYFPYICSFSFVHVFRDHDYVKSSEDFSLNSQDHVCAKSMQLEVKVQRLNETIKKLQAKCKEKTKNVANLRLALKRSEFVKSNLKETLEQMKKEKLISQNCYDMLNVMMIN